jgi:hypothetical protein
MPSKMLNDLALDHQPNRPQNGLFREKQASEFTFAATLHWNVFCVLETTVRYALET